MTAFDNSKNFASHLWSLSRSALSCVKRSKRKLSSTTFSVSICKREGIGLLALSELITDCFKLGETLEDMLLNCLN